MISIARKQATYVLDQTIVEAYKKRCQQDSINMNNPIEIFMKSYVDNEFILEIEHEIKQIKSGQNKIGYANSIEEEIQKMFKAACALNSLKMSPVVEAFMKAYAEGRFKLELKYNMSAKD